MISVSRVFCSFVRPLYIRFPNITPSMNAKTTSAQISKTFIAPRQHPARPDISRLDRDSSPR